MSTTNSELQTEKIQFNAVARLLAAVSAVSTASIFIRFAQKTYTSLFIAAGRLGIASLILLPFFVVKWKSVRGKINKGDIRLLILSGVFLAAHFASWIKSLELTNVNSSVVLVTTTPLWVSLFSFFLFHERLGRRFYIGLTIAFCGVVLILIGGACSFGRVSAGCLSEQISVNAIPIFRGNLLAVIGAVSAAVYILCGKKVRKNIDNLSYVFIVYSIASIILTVLCFNLERGKTPSLNSDFLWIVLLAVIPQLIGHTMINKSLGYLPASYVSLSLLGEPVGATLLAVAILGEIPSGLQILGSVIVLSGLLLATW